MDTEAQPTITVGETESREAYTIPVQALLTGRLFITGKSGYGKSNTASVIAEELLELGHPFLVVDVDGEYHGLKEEYEVLHVGATDECDLQVGPEHAPKLAELALEQDVPIVLDVSGYLDEDKQSALVRETARELFAREQDLKQPFLLLVEEVHEYIPEGGGLDDTGKMLIRVAKRGRKRGLGIAGISQRPADVKKDFITQADCLVWHRLTWENDTDVVRRVIDAETADAVQELAEGEAFVQADWSDSELERVQFNRKRTFDAGATPGLEDVERPELKSIGDDLVAELEEISDEHQHRQDRIAELEAKLEAKNERIADLEDELQQARDMSEMADRFTSALLEQSGDDGDVQQTIEAEVMEVREAKREAEARVADLQEDLGAREERIDELENEVDRLRSIEQRVEEAERIEQQLEEARDVLGVEVAGTSGDQQLQEARSRIQELEAENERLRDQSAVAVNDHLEAYEDFLDLEAVSEEIATAKQECSASPRYVEGVLAAIISERGPVGYETIAERLGVSTTSDVSTAASELERRKIITKDQRDDGMFVDLNTDGIEEIRAAAREREKTEELMEQL
jgi:hypothetical protein